MAWVFLSLAMSKPLIQLQRVSKSYPNSLKGGVQEIDLAIDKGEFIAILGESGSGKSTLLKLIYGLLSPSEGKVYFEGEPVLGPEEKLIPGHEQMKMIAQNFDLNTYAKVYDNIASMLSNTDLEGKKQKTWAMMQALRIDHLAERRAVELSGGEQQRVAIARALITKPQVLLLDEPFSQVDVLMRKQLRVDLKSLCRDLGITMILVSHDPLDGLSLADRLVVLQYGKMLQMDTPTTVIAQPKQAYVAKLLGGANIFSGDFAKQCLGLNLSPHQELVVYPHEITLAENGFQAKIEEVNYQLSHQELVLSFQEHYMYVQAATGTYRVGDTVSIHIPTSRFVSKID